MPVTLAQASLATQSKLDTAVIDEFRTSSLLDRITFYDLVNPAGGGGTLSHTYTRLASLSTAGPRAINAEYKPTEATKTTATVNLKVLGGAFQIDRVLAKLGPATASEVTFQMREKIRATQAEFAWEMIKGDSTSQADTFDGLSKMLAGTTTEDTTDYDLSAAMTETTAWAWIEFLDSILAKLDSSDNAVIIANRLVAPKIKAALRRLSLYVQAPGPLGTIRDMYGNVEVIDAGKRAGTNADIIPVTAGTTEVYAVRFGQDGFRGVSTVGGSIIDHWLPDFTTSGAVKTGEVEMGPVAVELLKTKAAAVARNVKIATP